MKLLPMVFAFETRVNKNTDPIESVITLTESDVPDETIIATLLGSSSPRVSFQTWARANGIPTAKTMSWAEWIGKPAPVAKPMTYEQIRDVAASDIDKARRLLADLQKVIAEHDKPAKPAK